MLNKNCVKQVGGAYTLSLVVFPLVKDPLRELFLDVLHLNTGLNGF